MNPTISLEKPSRVRYGVLGFCCMLSMVTYLDRACFGTVASDIQKEFGLTEMQRGWLFTAFTFAYAAFEIPTGWLGDRFGARMTLIRIVLWWSLFTALTGTIYPTPGSLTAFGLLFVIRFLFGIGEAGAYPNIARAFQSWFPYQERGFVKGAVWMSGRLAGGLTAFVVFALMYDTVAENGTKVVHWRHIFYIFGGVGILWCILWFWWYRDNPAEKAGVNAAELALIHDGAPPVKDKLIVPWGKLFASKNLWALCGMYFCSSFGWYINITYLPGLLKELGIERGDVKWTWQFWEAGLMAGLPLLVGSVSCLIGGVLTDQFVKRTGNRKWGRRLFGIIGHGMAAVCYFIAISYLKEPRIFVLLLAFAAFWNDLTMGSSWASCLDIGKRYAGIVAGCMNTVGNLGGAFANFLTAYILQSYTEGLAANDPALIAAKDQAWTANIFIFGAAYVVATGCWFLFDATKPVVPDSPKPAPPV